MNLHGSNLIPHTFSPQKIIPIHPHEPIEYTKDHVQMMNEIFDSPTNSKSTSTRDSISHQSSQVSRAWNDAIPFSPLNANALDQNQIQNQDESKKRKRATLPTNMEIPSQIKSGGNQIAFKRLIQFLKSHHSLVQLASTADTAVLKKVILIQIKTEPLLLVLLKAGRESLAVLNNPNDPIYRIATIMSELLNEYKTQQSNQSKFMQLLFPYFKKIGNTVDEQTKKDLILNLSNSDKLQQVKELAQSIQAVYSKNENLFPFEGGWKPFIELFSKTELLPVPSVNSRLKHLDTFLDLIRDSPSILYNAKYGFERALEKDLHTHPKESEIIRQADLLYNYLYHDQRKPVNERKYESEYNEYFQMLDTLRKVPRHTDKNQSVYYLYTRLKQFAARYPHICEDSAQRDEILTFIQSHGKLEEFAAMSDKIVRSGIYLEPKMKTLITRLRLHFINSKYGASKILNS